MRKNAPILIIRNRCDKIHSSRKTATERGPSRLGWSYRRQNESETRLIRTAPTAVRRMTPVRVATAENPFFR
ncbi:MAG: hypothetical protein MZU97_06465 [Bacillus subtilis]|nr:hypothetical protein [Bacillus subtilis]